MPQSTHTAPTQADLPWRRRVLVVGAGVAASMAVGAVHSPAHAGTDAEWNRLASCESSNNWSINTGNGYYGGLQFSKASWDWAGGRQFASHPHKATRAEQIAVAERLLDLQPLRNAWPACSRKLGLTEAQMQSGSATPPGGRATTPAPAPRATPAPAAPADQADTHRVRAGDTLARIAAQHRVAGGWQALWQANRDRVPNANVIRVGQVLRLPGAAAEPTPPPPSARDRAPTPESPPPSSDDDAAKSSVRVRTGDTLWEIARANGVSGGWSAVYNANRDRIDNPNVIRVGMVLRLP